MCNKIKLSVFAIALLTACSGPTVQPTKEQISELQLKRGNIISCGPPVNEFGKLNFEMSCDKAVQTDFNTAIALLHSFEYDEAEKMFAKVIDASPNCAMAYWGVAMCNFHPLWEPPTEENLIKGSKAIEIAKNIAGKTAREDAYITAVDAYYRDYKNTSPQARSLRFETAMQQVYNTYPNDKEAAIFYALALDAAAGPTDTTYTRQRRAGAILKKLYAAEPNHPGIIHYIIHTYDYPQIAGEALQAARRYAQVAPSSSHALHMPSHIFTRLGLWSDCIASNQQAVDAAKCYAQTTGLQHWDEELHGLDYLVYAYLQKGENSNAKSREDYVAVMQQVTPLNFKVAYAFAAIPARVALENKDWQKAANLALHDKVNWQKFAWQEAIVHFARVLGAVHTKQLEKAQNELAQLTALHDTLIAQKDNYKAKQVAVQQMAANAWLDFARGNTQVALQQMQAAAQMEDTTAKHPVTPGEVLPARELLGDMLLQAHQYEPALKAYQLALKKNPNRFNSLYAAGVAAENLGQHNVASQYYQQLLAVAPNSSRHETSLAKQFLTAPLAAK